MFMVNALNRQQDAVDLLIHETVLPPEVWAAAANGGQAGQAAITTAMRTGELAHAREGARWILDQAQRAARRQGWRWPRTSKPPTTHPSALEAVRTWYQGPFSIVTDLVVINVSSRRILQRRAVVSDYSPLPPTVTHARQRNLRAEVQRSEDKLAVLPIRVRTTGATVSVPAGASDPALPLRPDELLLPEPYAAYNPPPNPPGVTSMPRPSLTPPHLWEYPSELRMRAEIVWGSLELSASSCWGRAEV